MANRYCGNCGNEISQGTRFCPSCGRPTHETAQVSTPEANVDVPPTQWQGTGGPQGGQQGEQKRRHPILMGCLGIVVIVFLIGIIGAVAGGGDDTQAAVAEPKEIMDNRSGKLKALATSSNPSRLKAPARISRARDKSRPQE